MVVRASSSRRIVPGPESNNNFEVPTCIRTEHEPRFSDGTQVPEPRMVTRMPDIFSAMSSISVICLFLSYNKRQRAKCIERSVENWESRFQSFSRFALCPMRQALCPISVDSTTVKIRREPAILERKLLGFHSAGSPADNPRQQFLVIPHIDVGLCFEIIECNFCSGHVLMASGVA